MQIRLLKGRKKNHIICQLFVPVDMFSSKLQFKVYFLVH